MRTGGTRHPTADGVFRSHERGVSDRLPRASSCCGIRDTASSGVVKVEPYGERLLLMWSVACVLSPWIEGTWGNRPREQNRHTESAPFKPRNPQRCVRNQRFGPPKRRPTVVSVSSYCFVTTLFMTRRESQCHPPRARRWENPVPCGAVRHWFGVHLLSKMSFQCRNVIVGALRNFSGLSAKKCRSLEIELGR